MRDRWYKDAIIYELDVETFQDGNGDGIGDFPGLIDRIGYLARLGINTLWLTPCFPTPNHDDGYDVTDYYAVDPRLGTLGDFVEFLRLARERGIRVLIDLVVNHTSDQHPWFQAARSDPGSRYRDFYVWSENRPEDADEGMVFPGVQETTWTYDRKAKLYYFHRFYHHQPDLNITNPEVREEIRRIMGFWLELGVSGFRVDAAPFLIEMKGAETDGSADPYEYLREFRDFLSWRRGDAILLAEANVAMDQIGNYFGDGDKLHMLFDFMLNQHLFLALARENAGPLREGLRLTPQVPPSGQWAVFLRNHDELDLGRLTVAQREEVFAAFAPEPGMRIYERGIRRRLPPMLGGDPRRVRLAYSLLFSLPGTPVLRYGEEIGMGDDLELKERDAVRTPMQWSGDPGGGFSTAPPETFPLPLVQGEYGYEEVNVERQRAENDSLLQWMENLIRVRSECPEIGRGSWQFIDTGADEVFAHLCSYEGDCFLAVHNLCGEARSIRLDLSEYGRMRCIDLLEEEGRVEGSDRSEGAVSIEGDQLPGLELPSYGHRWLRLRSL